MIHALAIAALAGTIISFLLAWDPQVRKSTPWLLLNFAVTVCYVWLSIAVLV